jgi:DNA-binding MarR family transcriptional regulator
VDDGGHHGLSINSTIWLSIIENQVVFCRSSEEPTAMASGRPGYELPLLLIAAFRLLIDELHAELEQRGFADTRPLHGFALQAIGRDGATTSELGRRLGITKQAAAKTADGLERAGLIGRQADPADRRAMRLVLAPRGQELLATSAEIFDALHARWARGVGAARLAQLEDDLEAMVGQAGGVRLRDIPGWLR